MPNVCQNVSRTKTVLWISLRRRRFCAQFYLAPAAAPVSRANLGPGPFGMGSRCTGMINSQYPSYPAATITADHQNLVGTQLWLSCLPRWHPQILVFAIWLALRLVWARYGCCCLERIYFRWESWIGRALVRRAYWVLGPKSWKKQQNHWFSLVSLRTIWLGVRCIRDRYYGMPLDKNDIASSYCLGRALVLTLHDA